ncbi:hypothetical protein [Enterobacter sp. Bisph1]|uniref:hypothetical protein n=1 Tax=Enterobacter sp. Bisph1 TaxID=1274399 RepID=UPI00057C30BD|nr:hypothetical protein [Enterobacter sp. Bisph1]
MEMLLKSGLYLFVGIAATAICYSTIKNLFEKKVAMEILSDPCYVEATITDIVPGTPTSYGIVNITVNYEFTAINGKTFKRNNNLTAIKTMDLPKFQVGLTIPVVYLRSNPEKNMLNMRNAMENFKRPL